MRRWGKSKTEGWGERETERGGFFDFGFRDVESESRAQSLE
jgi:hypothetical protein